MANEEQVSTVSDKSKEKNKLLMIVGVLIMLVVLGGGFYLFKNFSDSSTKSGYEEMSGAPTSVPAPGKIEKNYTCAGDKTIVAIFNNDTDMSVDIALSDGITMNLPHVEAASGAKYTNEDESIVFWTQGNEAYLEEDGKETYSDCAVKPST
jgi:membrane-bound inhibitor of C-type lysozyme